MSPTPFVMVLGVVGAVVCLVGLVAQDVSGVLQRDTPVWSRGAALIGGLVLGAVVLTFVWTWTR